MSSNWNPNKQGKFRNSIGEETPAKRLSPQERNTFSTDPVQEKALLVSICPAGQTMERTEEYLDELAFLLETAGGVALKRVIQKLERPDTRTYVGSGKLEEIKEYKNALDSSERIRTALSFITSLASLASLVMSVFIITR